MIGDGGQCPLTVKAREAIAKYGMLENCPAVLVGVSGGADSMALLHFLWVLQKERGFALFAAHINHGLRGEEANRDERFLRDWCEQADIPLFVLHADVRAQAEKCGETIEEAGRRVRYGFFEEKAAKLGGAIATAHTLSDSIETMLFNLSRGAGLHGLCGIPAVRRPAVRHTAVRKMPYSATRIIRPLIQCARRDTEEYCRLSGIHYLDDSTNFSRAYTRNRIRLDLVPQFYALNPAFDSAAARLFANLEEDDRCLSDIAEKKLAQARVENSEYDISVFSQDCPTAILNRCVAYAAARYTGTTQEAKHIAAIAALIKKGGGKTEIRGGCFASVKEGRLYFTRSAAEKTQNVEFTFPFYSGIYENSKYKLVVSTISQESLKNLKNIHNPCFKNAVDCDKINGNALVRARKQGDKLRLADRKVTKTLKKLFNEQKIPIEQRAFVPVAADDEGVIWVGGIGVCERCRVTQFTQNAVLLELYDLEV
jgi:tRNA(Ile)-lysidine synthase